MTTHKVTRALLTKQDAHPVPQVLYVGEKDSKKLLEVYVRRSLSLNDGSQCPPWQEHRTSKRLPISQQNKKERKHSSDTSLHLKSSDLLEYIDDDAFSEPQPVGNSQASSEPSVNKSTVKGDTLNRNDSSSVSHCSVGKSTGKTRKWLLHFEKDKRDNAQFKENPKSECEHITYDNVSVLPQPDQVDSVTELKKPKEGKKKKPSIWKSFLEWFTKGHNDKQEEHVGDETEEAVSFQEPPTPQPSCLPFPSDVVHLRQNRASKKGWAHRRFSLKRRSGDMGADKAAGRPLTLDLNADAQKAVVQSITEVEPTCLYYEKVSEELQKIVYEVKHSPIDENRRFTDSAQPTDISEIPLSKEEVITRIFDLIKQKGDDMDCKLKENPAISSYFSTLSYGTFQQLADQYVKSEVSQQTVQPPVAAPELVKFAFTLDFTARVAGLSRHTPGHIVGFGNQYLKDRFTYMSENNPHFADMKAEGGNTSKDHLDKGET